MKKGRINYIDYTKGYGILLIVLFHLTGYFNACHNLSGYIESYCVSIFFIISGVLMTFKEEKYESWNVFLRKKYRSLLIPYIWFSIFNSLLKLSVLFATHQLTESVVHSEMIELFITGNGTVWFLLTLFGAELLYRMVVGICNEFQIAILAIACIMLCFLVGGEIKYPVAITLLRILAAFSFLVSGVFAGKYILNKYDLGLYVGIALLLSGIFSYLALGSGYSFFYGVYEKPLASLLAVFLNSFGSIIILKNIRPDIEFWKYLGRNSLIIMLVHPTILLLYTYPAHGSFNLLPVITQWFVVVSIFTTIVLAEVPFIWLINNKLPFLIGKSKIRK